MRGARFSWLLAGLAACSSSSSKGFDDTSGSDASTRAPVGDAGVDVPTVKKLSSPDSGSSGGGTGGTAVVYGQSATTLYALDPDTKAVSAVGTFSGCDSAVIDIALDKSSAMYATTFGGVYTIDTSTAACHLIATGSYPNSLSFVPAGTLDPNEEALVGYVGSTYVRIDTTSGAITDVGSLGKNYTSSGDIVSVIGGGTYLTVTGGEACSVHDCLVSVNPATGALVTNYGSVDHSEVYGLAFWGSSSP